MTSLLHDVDVAAATTTSSLNKQQDEGWQSPPSLLYHLETVGIGDIFLEPPPKNSLYKTILTKSHSDNCNHANDSETHKIQEEGAKRGEDIVRDCEGTQQWIKTWEIVGTIKSCPQDFVVREIGGTGCLKKKHRNGNGDNINSRSDNASDQANNKTAHLTDLTTLPHQIGTNQINHELPRKTIKVDETHNCLVGNGGVGEETEIDSSTTTVKKINGCSQSQQNMNLSLDNQVDDDVKKEHSQLDDEIEKQQPNIKYVTSSKEVVKAILTQCCKRNSVDEEKYDHSCDAMSDPLFDDIQQLYQEALDDVKQLSTQTSRSPSSNEIESNKYVKEFKRVVIPPIFDDVLIRHAGGNKTSLTFESTTNRGTLHRTLKVAYPLLETSAIKQEQSNGCDYYVQVAKDTTFHSIIPFLSHAQDDLVKLYRFRNTGIVKSNDEASSMKRHNNNRMRRQRDSLKRNTECEHDNKTTTNSSNGKANNDYPTAVYLRLRPELVKNQRREIHHLIGKASRDLDTGTKNDYTYEENNTTKKCSTITVYWSNKAQQKAMKHMMITRKRKHLNDTNTSKNECKNTLCVVKKVNQEHLAMIHHMVAALKCRQSDISFAGMKDMRAITYQFCTLKIDPQRVRAANHKLKEKSISLGNFQMVDWFLQPGMLEGNQFEITIRNMKRVEIQVDDKDIVRERFINCESSHLEAMVARVKRNGFVNFFGEQRVGSAGPNEEVGVRSSDIGRAMLKRKYADAINLLMTGRNKLNGDFVESESMRNVRQTWKDSNGDPGTTLAAYPNNGYIMLRERTVLKGLKRYGNDKPLDALKCLPYSVRLFWVNAYQSLVWNKMATERLRIGSRPLVGDLYISEEGDEQVKFVTDPLAVNMKDIVLPLPGYNIQYPQNSIGVLYKKFLANEGIEFKRDDPQEVSAKGAYRHVIRVPKTLDWRSIDLCSTTFNFSLYSGSYATMLLRELMYSQIARSPLV